MSTGGQVSKAAQLWAQWHSTHELATAALSSAVNIHQRLEVITEQRNYANGLWQQQPNIQELVLGKQLASFEHALGLVRNHHDSLQGVVRDMERLSIEAVRGLTSSSSAGRVPGRAPGALQAAAAVPSGPEPTPVQLVDAVQDMWTMCRDELLLKLAVIGLLRLDSPVQDTTALLQCYTDQPNVDRRRVDAVLSAYREARPPTAVR